MTLPIVPGNAIGSAVATARQPAEDSRPAAKARPAAETRPASESPRAVESRPEAAPASPVALTPNQEADARAALARLQEAGESYVFADRTIEFTYDEAVGRIVVKVKSEDGEVIRQIPPEEYLTFATRFREQLGVLFDGVF